MPNDPQPVAGGERLTADEAEQLAAYVAQVVGAEVPLAEGLRAAADESGSRRLGRVMSAMATEVEAGQPLEAVVASRADCFGRFVAGAISAAARSRNMADVLGELVEYSKSAHDMRRALWRAVAYPLFVVVAAYFLFLGMAMVFTEPVQALYEQFEEAPPTATFALLWWGEHGWWITLVALAAGGVLLLVLRRCMPAALRRRLLASLPVVGRLIHWWGVCEMARLMAVALRQQLSVPAALRLTADGISDADVAESCRLLAGRVEQGMGLCAALERSPRLPGELAPLAAWGEENRALPEAFDSVRELLEERIRSRTLVLRSILPPIAFVIVGLAAGYGFAALYLSGFKILEMINQFS